MLPHIDPVDLPDAITVTKLSDPMIESLGYPMGSDYCETFWLSTLGPTTLWLARALARAVEHGPVSVPLVPLAQQVGISPTLGKNGPLARSVTRLRVFDVARWSPSELAIRTHLPPLNSRQVKRLPAHLAALVKAEVSA